MFCAFDFWKPFETEGPGMKVWKLEKANIFDLNRQILLHHTRHIHLLHLTILHQFSWKLNKLFARVDLGFCKIDAEFPLHFVEMNLEWWYDFIYEFSSPQLKKNMCRLIIIHKIVVNFFNNNHNFAFRSQNLPSGSYALPSGSQIQK